MDFFIDSAWAAAEPGAANPVLSFLPLIIIFAVFYFLLIRPQSKRAKAHRQMVDALATGDEVVTNGGILGRITNVGEQFVTLEVAEGIELRVQRHTVGALLPKGTYENA